MNVQTAAFVVGMILGSGAVSSAAFVWIRYRAFGTGGSVLSLLGVALVGLSIWSSVKINVSDQGFQAEFQKLAQQVDAVAESSQAGIQANREVAQEVKNVAEATEAAKQQFIELTTTLEAKGTLDPAKRAEILRPVLTAPVVDLKRLDSATKKLEDASKVRATRVKP
jgi:hypothetical protein